MEEAISKFMEGVEKEECTGYNALLKLLQGLPMPEQKNASIITQAKAIWTKKKRIGSTHRSVAFMASIHR
jgi:hypothetical protein